MKYKISVVNYLNSKPFIYGLEHSGVKNEIELQLDIPSACARKLEENKVDIGLIPVAVLPGLEEYHIISNYCIGADGEVSSVLLLSEVPLDEITTILLDNESRTSVLLVQVLAEKFWNIKPRWVAADEGYEDLISGPVAGVMIGDRTFSNKKNFRYAFDLSGEWKKFTHLPFVFACWVSNKELPPEFIKRLNDAFALGLAGRKEIIREYVDKYPTLDIQDYFENKISFTFDDRKKKSLDLFLTYIKELKKSDLLKTA